jgi:hypothetical protein
MLEELPKFKALSVSLREERLENFFQHFEQRLGKSSVTFDFYRWIDEWLSYIPIDQWKHFEERIRKTVNKRDIKKLRYWEKMHDVLFESFGFRILHEKMGCENPEYIFSSTRAPDFQASKDSVTQLLEVKKINESQDQVEVFYGDRNAYDIHPTLEMLKRKIDREYHAATTQLDAYSLEGEVIRNTLMVVDPDVFLHVWPKNISDEIDEIFVQIEKAAYPLHRVIILR